VRADGRAFVSLVLVFAVQLCGDRSREVGSAVSHDVERAVNRPQIVNPKFLRSAGICLMFTASLDHLRS